MSANEGSLGSGGSVAPPPSSPAPASPQPTAAPAAAPAAPVEAPVAPPSTEVAPVQPSASTPERDPQEAARERYQQRIAKLKAGESDQEALPAEDAEPEQPLVAAEPEVPIEEPEALAPEKQVAAPETEDVLDDTTPVLLTDAEVDALRISQPQKAVIKQATAQAAQMREIQKTVGGEVGLEVASAIVPLILQDCPFNETTEPAKAQEWWEQTADNFLDQMTLPEHAGASKLFNYLSHHFVNTALYEDRPATDPATGQPIVDASGRQLPVGEVFVNKLIGAEWGVQPDGEPYDLATVKTLVEAHKRGLINMEFVNSELAEAVEEVEPTEREKELLAENEKLKAETQADTDKRKAKEEEQKREDDRRMAAYRVQAKGFISRQVMKPLMPEIVSLGWAPAPGETGPQVEQKQFFADLITNWFNAKLEGTRNDPAADYAAAMAMVDDGTAFDAAGRPTPRFKKNYDPLITRGRALMNKAKRNLGPVIKFAGSNSRDAQLAKKNGKVHEEPTEVPPVAARQEVTSTPETDPDYWEKRQAAAKERLHQQRIAAERATTVGRL